MISFLNRLFMRKRPMIPQPSVPAPSPEQSQLRFCRDCKHRREVYADYDGCFAPQNLKVDVVHAREVRRLKYCETLRNTEGDWYCGADARWFEPK